MWDPFTNFRSRTLTNGLSVYALHEPDREWLDLRILVHSGSMHDPEGLEGLSHLLEHILARMLEEHCEEFIEKLELHGGENGNKETGYFHVGAKFIVPAKPGIIEELIRYVASVFTMDDIEEDLLESERKIVLREFFEVYPAANVYERSRFRHLMLYSDFWLERMPAGSIGTVDGIKRIQKADILQFLRTHYTPSNMSVLGIGCLDIDRLTSILENSAFGYSASGEMPSTRKTIEIMCPLKEKRVIYRKLRDQKGRALSSDASLLNYVRIPGSFTKYEMILLRIMMHRSLMRTIRKKRSWSYSVHCTWEDLQGLYEFVFGVPAFLANHLEEVERLIEADLLSLEESAALFEYCKSKMVACVATMDLSLKDIASYASDSLILAGIIETLAMRRDGFASVEFSRIQELLEWFQPHRRLTEISLP